MRTLILSRRNLLTLWVKLARYPENSACSIIKSDQYGERIMVLARPDEEVDREPARMTEDERSAIEGYDDPGWG